MFWNRTPRTETPRAPDEPSPLEGALDTVGIVLNVIAEHAVTIDDLEADETRRAAMGWRSHLLTGAPHPESGEAGGRRDWAGARRFLTNLRKAEAAAIASVQQRFRDALWDVMQAVMEVYRTDRSIDDELTERIGRLTSLHSGASDDDFRREALATVELVRSRLEERTSRHTNVVQALGSRLRTLQKELQQARGEMKLDPLTRVYNRAGLDAELQRVERVATLLQQTASLLMVDIDHFKSVNDQHGHPAGDRVLAEVAARTVRAFPRKRDVVARYGGEEFAVILHDTTVEDADRLGQRLLDAIADRPVDTGDASIDVTVSIGVATIQPGESAASLVRRADAALYEAKRAGRNRLRVAAPQPLDAPGVAASTETKPPSQSGDRA